ncbi:hypothetical protein [Rhizobium sp. BK602]|uniref:hypothetical protein n=1 Tax=Rhizobium sp. BK602 TaxID=2586986 RepID=UPI00160BB561|nr:hypothetical protein [Rhizobium sp. BK602]MBB3608688.1 hypothetical protein [Rhizobium sp. BK602]
MLAFLISPIGKFAGGLLVIVALLVGFKLWLHEHDKGVLAGYVAIAEKTTAEAKAAEMERQRNAASQALSEVAKRQAADEAAQRATDAQTDLELFEYEKRLAEANRQCLINDADRSWLLKH